MKRSVPLIAAMLFLIAGPALARQVPIDGTHSRDEIRRICKEQGGDFTGNLDGYLCFKACPGGTCIVSCDAAGHCSGQVPKGAANSAMPGKATPKAILRSLK